MAQDIGLRLAQRKGQITELEQEFSSGSGPRHPNDQDPTDAPQNPNVRPVSRRGILIGVVIVTCITAAVLVFLFVL